MRESVIEQHLVRVATRAGWECHKLVWPGRRHAPDRLLLRDNAALVFVEVKASGGRVRAGQRREHARLRAMGFRVAVLSSKDEIEEYFACHTLRSVGTAKRGSTAAASD